MIKYVVNGRIFRLYGRAVNYCVNKRISIDKIEKMSKNEDIETVCGKRGGGIPVQFPFEMDYFCPICGKPPVLEDINENEKELLKLHFSEYNYFMWCEQCNLDIPSFLCLRADSRIAVGYYTKRYLEMIQMIQHDMKVRLEK